MQLGASRVLTEFATTEAAAEESRVLAPDDGPA